MSRSLAGRSASLELDPQFGSSSPLPVYSLFPDCNHLILQLHPHHEGLCLLELLEQVSHSKPSLHLAASYWLFGHGNWKSN